MVTNGSWHCLTAVMPSSIEQHILTSEVHDCRMHARAVDRYREVTGALNYRYGDLGDEHCWSDGRRPHDIADARLHRHQVLCCGGHGYICRYIRGYMGLYIYQEVARWCTVRVSGAGVTELPRSGLEISGL